MGTSFEDTPLDDGIKPKSRGLEKLSPHYRGAEIDSHQTAMRTAFIRSTILAPDSLVQPHHNPVPAR
jgi:hypothetical protein